MEDDLKILKVEYISNHLLDHAQILNSSSDHILKIIKVKMTSKGRRPTMEDNHKILKVKYLSNHLLDPTQILNLSLDYQK